MLPELASFPGLPTVWFLIVYSMQKMEGGGRPANIYYMSDVNVYLGGHGGRGASNQRIHFTHAFFVSNNKLQFFSTWIVTARPQDLYFGPIQLTSVGLPSTSAFIVSMYICPCLYTLNSILMGINCFLGKKHSFALNYLRYAVLFSRLGSPPQR